MGVVIVKEKDKEKYNRLAEHPLQLWQWGEFKQKTGMRPIRLALVSRGKFKFVAQLLLRRLPFTSYYVGHVLKSPLPPGELIDFLRRYGRKERIIFIKLRTENYSTENTISKVNKYLYCLLSFDRLCVCVCVHACIYIYIYQVKPPRSTAFTNRPLP